MTGGMARYAIGRGEHVKAVRIFMNPKDEKDLSAEEVEARDAVLEGFLRPEYAGKVGNSVDPFKAAEAILADHYGYAKMVEAHYEWRPKVRY